MTVVLNTTRPTHEGLATNSQRIPILWDGPGYSAIQRDTWLPNRGSPHSDPLPCYRTLVYSQGCQMNNEQLVKVLEDARVWTNAEYEAKTTPETNRYHIQKQIARLELLHYIADTYIEQRENAKLQS